MPLTEQEINDFRKKAKQLRLDIIDTMVWAGGAHVGGALSLVEILILLYFKYLKIDPSMPDWPERDRVILSKGHAGVGFAPLLSLRGYFDKEELKSFNHFKSPFGMHLDGNKVKGVDASTGSLGHGLSIAVGLAIGAQRLKAPWKTYCILGDGECNEGSVWEAAMAASHFKLGNLIAIIDRNGLMIDGPTEQVMGLEPLGAKLTAFGFNTMEVDGHDYTALAEAFETAQGSRNRPTAIVAKTVKGKGVDFMENETKWHYGSVDSELAAKAKKSIEETHAEEALHE